MKDTKRMLRRHHVARLKKARRFHWGRDLINDPKRLAKTVNTPCSCSCHMCGNPRKWWNEKTMQELKFEETAQMVELVYTPA